MVSGSTIRTRDDLERVVRTLTFCFRTDAAVIIGSQSVLVTWPDAPSMMRTSGEIDAYPANARILESAKPEYEVSEEIHALFGDGSQFQETHGFYIDGVDSNTAVLPPEWQRRTVYHEMVDALDGRILRAISPCMDDIIVSKLARLEEKDIEFIRICNDASPLNIDLLRARTAETDMDPERVMRAMDFLSSLPRYSSPSETAGIEYPPIPIHSEATHAAFMEANGVIRIREWNPDMQLFNLTGNTHGPAIVGTGETIYAIAGKVMSETEWRNDPRVQEIHGSPGNITPTT